MQIADRLAVVLNGRKKYPWGERIGLGRNAIQALSSGRMPTAEKLLPIVRADNVSLSWLLDGRGDPFLVSHDESAEQLAHHLRDLLDEEDWTVHLVTSPTRAVFVLTQPGQYQVGQRWIDYTIVEIVAGPLGPAVVEALAEALPGDQILHVQTDTETVDRLAGGWMGNRELLGDEEQPGLLSRCTHIGLDVLEAAAADTTSSEERVLLEKFRRLTPQNKHHAWAVVNALADGPDSDGEGGARATS